MLWKVKVTQLPATALVLKIKSLDCRLHKKALVSLIKASGPSAFMLRIKKPASGLVFRFTHLQVHCQCINSSPKATPQGLASMTEVKKQHLSCLSRTGGTSVAGKDMGCWQARRTRASRASGGNCILGWHHGQGLERRMYKERQETEGEEAEGALIAILSFLMGVTVEMETVSSDRDTQ